MQILAFLRAFFRASWREYAVVFVCAVGLYGWLAPRGGFPDPDSFYHANMVALMLEQGVVRAVPLPFTTLADAFADHHFLYHAFAMPFVAAFGSLQGVAIAAIVLAAGAVTAVHHALRAYAVRWAPAFTLLVATSAGFAFRMGLAKASSVAVILLMLALVAFRRGSTRTLFVLAFAYVWSHGGWPVLWGMAGAFVAARAFMAGVEAVRTNASCALMVVSREVVRSREMRGALAVVAGSLAGLVINPYFPTNIAFYREQIFQIAVVGHAEGVGMGAEWYPHDPGGFFFEGGGVSIAIALVLAMSAGMAIFDEIRRRDAVLPSEREVIDAVATMLMACAFFVLTLRSKRHIEYFVPFGAVSTGVLFTMLFARLDAAAFMKSARTIFPWPRRAPEVLIGYFLAALLLVGGRSVLGTERVTQEAVIPWTKYSGAIEVLRAEAADGAVVLSSDWDDFPVLFHGVDRVRSVAGLDPMFLYRKDPERYRTWQAIATGKVARIGERAKEVFDASYVLVERDHTAMRANAMRDPFLLLVHEDDDAALYQVR